MCGIFGIAGTLRRPTSPTSGCTRCSTAGRSPRASSPPTESACTRTAPWGWWRTSSPRRCWRSCRATRPSATCATRRPAAATLKNAQPLSVDYAGGQLAVAHNGNLVNAAELRERARGGRRHLPVGLGHRGHHPPHRPLEAGHARGEGRRGAAQVKGAYSLLFLTAGPARRGARSATASGRWCWAGCADAYVLASETTALDLIEAEFVREVEPGEMVVIDEKGLRTLPALRAPTRLGALHLRARLLRAPDSVLFGASVYEVRKALGGSWRASSPRRGADLVDRGAGLGRAGGASASRSESGIPFDMGLIRSHYVGRTFIEPQQSIRHFGVKLKLIRGAQVLKGKRVVVVDDSIVRGTTSRKIVKMLRRPARRGAPAHLEPADALALLLRHRHAEPPGADRHQPHGGGDRPLRDGRLAGLPLARGPGQGGGRHGAQHLLHGVLHREVPRGADQPRGRRPDAKDAAQSGAEAAEVAVATGPETVPGKHLTA